jgi:dephospho-CoA kinase
MDTRAAWPVSKMRGKMTLRAVAAVTPNLATDLTPLTRSRPPVIGIVGGIGSGKSTVGQALRELGCVVANSDDFARQALRDPTIRRQIVKWWGQAVLDPSTGEVDRSRIARIVFANPDERRRLETLTHPWIEAKRRELFDAAPPETPALVIDAPLLLEAGLDRECDLIIFVEAPADLRLRRVMDSRGWTQAQVRDREAAQMPLDAKRARADHVIVNTGDLATLHAATRGVLDKVVAGASRKPPDLS